MDIEKEITRFKFELLRKMPFYGDIVMRLPFVENKSISTAQTDGTKIEYNPDFFSKLTRGERNFVLMHEIFHVLLFHCERHNERNPRIWNTAADMVVNKMLSELMPSMRREEIPFQKPADGVFADISSSQTVEEIYEQLLIQNKNGKKNSKKVSIRSGDSGAGVNKTEIKAPDDIILESDTEVIEKGIQTSNTGKNNAESEGLGKQILKQVIRESIEKNRTDFGSYYVPQEIYNLVESKRIKWQNLLRDFLVEEQSDESSYTTPERKYIHMDLILPGYSLDDERIEEIWAFVDSSGSISKNETEQFLTQLYRICKEFKCVFNICYWDTEVTDVYKKILKKEDILKSVPNYSGGTDINCVYRWLKENKIKPDVMLILTDGYFGTLDRRLYVPSLAKKTIMVLSEDIIVNDEMKKIGKITRLE